MPNPTLARVNVDELAQFREIQQLAYQCVEAVGGMLRPGMTEKDAARLLTEWLGDRGVHDWLHKPFAWFGDRTAFQGFSGLTHMAGFNMAFFPSSRRLEENMPVILDVAPVRNGVIADVGYATCVGENAILEQLLDDLMAHRELIVRLIRERRPMADVARAVDQLCMKQGVEPRHKAYPFKVLAHRVAKLEKTSKPRFVARFGLNATRNLILDQVRSGKQEGGHRCGRSTAAPSTHPYRVCGPWSHTWAFTAWAPSSKSCSSLPKTMPTGSTTTCRTCAGGNNGSSNASSHSSVRPDACGGSDEDAS